MVHDDSHSTFLASADNNSRRARSIAMACLRPFGPFLKETILVSPRGLKFSNFRTVRDIIGIVYQLWSHFKPFISMTPLDPIDRKILSVLQSDGRITMAELADKVGLSVSPCHRRVKLLEERGVITRYIATVDQKSVGLHVSVFISIKLARQKEEDLDRFARAISKWEEVLECYLMTGNRDYLLRVVAADLSSYEAFLKNKLTRLDGIASIESSFALSQVKYSIALPV
jgi:Lrp/AsnC family leucine-responsive transcriptional regulator